MMNLTIMSLKAFGDIAGTGHGIVLEISQNLFIGPDACTSGCRGDFFSHSHQSSLLSPLQPFFLDPSTNARRERPVWQRRFWEHQIRDEQDWRNHVDYIHYNPVKHNLVEQPGDWPWSSFHRAVARGWYQNNWGITLPSNITDMERE